MKKWNRELRVLPLNSEMRFAEDEQKFIGEAIVYAKRSDLLFGFMYEEIKPGAAKKALENSDVRALFNHNPDYILGRKSAGTLEIIENLTGVEFMFSNPGTTAGNDLQLSVKRGDIRECSFSFSVSEDAEEWELMDNGIWLRTIHEFDEIFDLGPVTFPAYPSTTVGYRSFTKEEIIKRYAPTPPNNLNLYRSELELFKLK